MKLTIELSNDSTEELLQARSLIDQIIKSRSGQEEPKKEEIEFNQTIFFMPKKHEADRVNFTKILRNEYGVDLYTSIRCELDGMFTVRSKEVDHFISIANSLGYVTSSLKFEESEQDLFRFMVNNCTGRQIEALTLLFPSIELGQGYYYIRRQHLQDVREHARSLGIDVCRIQRVWERD